MRDRYWIATATAGVTLLAVASSCGRVRFDHMATTSGTGASGDGEATGGLDAAGGRGRAGEGTTGGSAGGGGAAPPSGWHDEDARARLFVAFNNSAQATEDLVRFPVPIELTTANFDYSSARAGGEDLRFIDIDGTRLSHEIERWVAGGDSVLWVGVPQIDRGSASDGVWLYFDNPAATVTQDPTGVFNAGYEGVFHLNDGDLGDSSGNGNDGTSEGAATAGGRIAGGALFVGTENDRIVTGDTNYPTGTQGRTLCAWGRPAAADCCEKEWLVSYGTFTPGDGFFVGRVGEDLWCGGVGDDIIAPAVFTADTWVYACCVYDTGEVSVYAGGKRVAGPETKAWTLVADQSYIGGHINPVEWWDGAIDEVRVSSVPRSPDWLAAEAASMSGAFATVGSIEHW